MNKMRYALPFFAIICIGLLAFAFAMPAHADSPTTLRPVVVGQAGGVASAVVYDNGYLYFNIGPRIVRMDVLSTRPDQPLKPEKYGPVLPGVPQDMKLVNGYLYAALGASGVAVINPTSLSLVSTPDPAQEIPGNGGDSTVFESNIAVRGQYLYASAGSTGIVVYDLGPSYNDLRYLQTKSFTNPNRTITDVEVNAAPGNGDVSLYVSANNNAADPALRGGVLKFDLTTAPTLNAPARLRGQIDVVALKAYGSHVFAAGASNFYVLSASDLAPENGDFPLGNAPTGLVLNADGSLACLLSAAGIDVLSLGTPTAPVALTAAPFASAGAAADVAPVHFAGVGATVLYVADFDAGLSIALAADATPGVLALVNPSYIKSPASIVRSVAGTVGQAFMAGSVPTLETVNNTNPAALAFVGSGIPMSTTISSMRVRADRLYATAGTAGLLRYTLKAGQEPADEEKFTTGGTAAGLALAWPNAVIADGTNGMVIVHIDGPLELTGSAPAPEFNSNFRSVDVQGNYAYVVDANGTFRVYDLTDPSGPIALGVLKLQGMLDVKVRGNFAYVAFGTRGLRIIDISNSNAPVFVGNDYFELPGLAQGLALYDHYLLVAAGDAGFHMLSIADDGQLTPAASFHLGGNTRQVLPGNDGYLYAASEDAGMAMISFNAFQLYLPTIRGKSRVNVYLPKVRK